MKNAIELSSKLLALALVGWGPQFAMAAAPCGELANTYGPIDYRRASGEEKVRVEGAHFTPNVETLTSGKSGYIGSDIDYTLRVFPNSPRALLSMSRLGIKEKKDVPLGARYTTECYFDRAFRFAPDDPLPHMIRAIYLKSHGRKTEALAELETTEKLKTEILGYEFPYNMGLEYADLGQYDKALQYAYMAYDFGAPFPGLRRKLEAAGKWREPELHPADQSPPASEAPEQDTAK